MPTNQLKRTLIKFNIFNFDQKPGYNRNFKEHK